MSTPADRGWGPGWPSDNAAAHVVDAEVGAKGIVLKMRREITVLADRMVRELEAARGRPFDAYGCWGYQNRPVKHKDGSPSTTPSNHSWGLAIDLDAPHNGQGDKGFGSMPHLAGAIAAKYGFRWGGWTGVGGTYSTTPDPMHYEYAGTPEQAAQLTAKLEDDLSASDVQAINDNTNTRIGAIDRNGVIRHGEVIARIAAVEAALAASPDNPVTQDMLNKAVAAGLRGALITIDGA